MCTLHFRIHFDDNPKGHECFYVRFSSECPNIYSNYSATLEAGCSKKMVSPFFLNTPATRRLSSYSFCAIGRIRAVTVILALSLHTTLQAALFYRKGSYLARR